MMIHRSKSLGLIPIGQITILSFVSDIIKYISRWLPIDLDKFNLMRTCKDMMNIGLLFEEEHHFGGIFESSLYHNFTNISIGESIIIINKTSIDGNVIKLPNKINQLRFLDDFYGMVKSHMIPMSVEKLILGDFLCDYDADFIPSSVKYLMDFRITKNNICMPTSIIYLSASIITKNIMPLTITHLKINNGDIKYIPKTVTHLVVDGNIYSRLMSKSIPTSITHLAFGRDINKSIKKCSMPSVTHLTFSDKYNYPIKNYISSSIEKLTFGTSFNQPIKGYIPKSVKKIIIRNEKYSHELPSQAIIRKRKKDYIKSFGSI